MFWGQLGSFLLPINLLNAATLIQRLVNRLTRDFLAFCFDRLWILSAAYPKISGLFGFFNFIFRLSYRTGQSPGLSVFRCLNTWDVWRRWAESHWGVDICISTQLPSGHIVDPEESEHHRDRAHSRLLEQWRRDSIANRAFYTHANIGYM